MSYRLNFSIFVISILYTFSAGYAFAHSWMAPADEAKKNNPIASSKDSIANGKVIFDNKCIYCHGNGAKGSSKNATGLSKDTPNLVKRLKTHTDGDFHWKIINGKGEMPSFQKDLTYEEIWDIINYIKSLEDEK